MNSYGQFCPLAQATQLLCERWTLLIIREFVAGSTRFNELRKGVPLMSPTLLSRRLKQLEDAGVICRDTSSPARNSYQLTQAGMELRPVVELMGAWGHRWARSKLGKDDLDASLLMWDMRRSVDPEQFPKNRVVVQFEYPDAPDGARKWWLISEEGQIDLCLNDPGYDVDLMIESSLETMTAVWTCQKKFQKAVDSGMIKVMGDTQLKRKLPDWLRSSLLSHLGTLETMPTLEWA